MCQAELANDRELDVCQTYCFRHRLQEMKCQEGRLSIRVPVASERELHFRLT